VQEVQDVLQVREGKVAMALFRYSQPLLVQEVAVVAATLHKLVVLEDQVEEALEVQLQEQEILLQFLHLKVILVVLVLTLVLHMVEVVVEVPLRQVPRVQVQLPAKAGMAVPL
jgi:hypothetical protein